MQLGVVASAAPGGQGRRDDAAQASKEKSKVRLAACEPGDAKSLRAFAGESCRN